MRTIGALTAITVLLGPATLARAQQPAPPPASPAPQPQPAPQAQPAPAPQAQPAPAPAPAPAQAQPYPPPPPGQYPPQGPYQYPPGQYPQGQPYPAQPYPYPPGPPTGYGSYPVAPYYQPPPQGPDRLMRRGLVLGFSVGGGSLQYGGEGHGGFGMGFGIGGMLNSQVALLFDLAVLSRQLDSYADESHSIFGGAIQVFLARILWVKAGLGLSRWSVTDDYELTKDSSELALAGSAAVGVEVLQVTSGFALDLQLRFAASRFRDPVSPTRDKLTLSQTALLLGFNFY